MQPHAPLTNTTNNNLTAEKKFVESQQLEGYFNEANDQNLAGALVWSLTVWLVHDTAPAWTWLPNLIALYVVTVLRTAHIWQFKHSQENFSSRYWINGQALFAGLAGICWGVSAAFMLPYLSHLNSFLLVAVIGVAVAVSSSEGTTLAYPSRAFSIACTLPASGWLLINGEYWDVIVVALLLVMTALTIWQGKKRNEAFIESRQLLFRNQNLVQELAHQRDVAERANHAKTRFLAAVSHDMRQPLQSAVLLLYMLGQRLTNSEDKHLLGKVEGTMSGMQELLEGVLDISQLEAGVAKVNRKAVSLSSLWQQLEQTFSDTALSRELQLRLRPSPLWVQSDPYHLKRILQNLVANALRYTNRGGVLIAARMRGNQVWLEVWDTGMGIPQDRMQEIFHEFVQLHNPERDRRKGLGLGLAIVQRTANLLEHELQVLSRPDRGSLFRVILPRIDVDAAVSHDSSTLVDHPMDDLSGLFVLIVEDNSDIRLAMQGLLESWGCLVSSASDGQSACAAMEQVLRAPDVMLLDYRLPDGDGVSLSRKLYAILDAQPPTLCLTGDVTAPELKVMHDSGLNVLHKPVNPDQLRHYLAQFTSHNN